MKTTLIVIEILLALLLVLFILLHSPKGDGLAGIGGSAKLFKAPKGMESGLNKITGVIAGFFVAIAVILGTQF